MIESILRVILNMANPVGAVWSLLTLWLVIALFRRRLAALPVFAWFILTVTTCTPLASSLLNRLELQTPPVSLDSLPGADAIICLGGGAEPSLKEPIGVHFKRGADRVPTSLLLANSKKAGTLVVAGGGYRLDGKWLSEADAVAKYLEGSTTVKLISLGICADTHDEALKTSELAREHGWKNVLLVTSASHMPRAVATFTKAGVNVTPVPCDYQSSFSRVGNVKWVHLPHENSFQIFSTWFHEIVGQWVYRQRGWI